jgi:hypothetical protein
MQARRIHIMGYSPRTIELAVEVAKAAVSSGDKAGFDALNHPDEVAKLIETVAKQIDTLNKP